MEISQNQVKIFKKIQDKFECVIVPSPTKSYKIQGLKIIDSETHKVLGKIIVGNTFRGYHRINTDLPGGSIIVNEFFEQHSVQIASDLAKIRNRREMDEFANKLSKKIKRKLHNKIIEAKLKSYNKCRKLVDLYLVHYVLLSNEIKSSVRTRLISCLFVPLDSQILNEIVVATCPFNLPIKLTMSDVQTKDQYDMIQNQILKISLQAKLTAPIAFDLLWRKRYEAKGSDFLELSKAVTSRKP